MVDQGKSLILGSQLRIYVDFGVVALCAMTSFSFSEKSSAGSATAPMSSPGDNGAVATEYLHVDPDEGSEKEIFLILCCFLI